MGKHILITGGAGFIGSHLADELLGRGYRVRALDNLSEQVHGPERKRPDYLNSDVELHVGDVRDPVAVERALDGIDAVYHFAAAVGVGQSMYEVEKYLDVNTRGTAVLLEALIKKPVERLVVASSMSIYGEGLYYSPDGKVYAEAKRDLEQLKRGDWEVCNEDGEVLIPISTPERKSPVLTSVYALSKYDQERACLMIGRAYGISTVALRFFNVFGIRQAFSNPYTGVLAIFASRLLNDKSPLIYEDGYQQRDFISVYDVALACRLALEAPEAAGKVFNIGSGSQYTILEVAERMAEVFGKRHIRPEVTGKYRMGDIRHCFADITLARQLLKFDPRIGLEEGLVELSEWLKGKVAYDRIEEASAELAGRGLTV
ncbi:MAG: SDR family NAD(P)-dependent oxidoreductase [Alphaproteobacteria bacterium]|uniref:SDR family NAD(P)-dependent oxidoreductase n=1 Tax=Candidatus Nitrobium versatile TaxID=2884831 RepID=A0A953M2C1_9BACT|nr:SDR family NAD(P)-dependent oxidoreductase [Candidatus Nitrobium versatile]